MGHFYEHARLIAEATSPEGATVKLMGINNEENVKQDIIQSGWGNPQGYEIGGKDFSQVLNLKAIFSLEGEYEVTLKLIDRGNSDSVISEKQYKFNVLAESVPEENEKEETEATTGNTNISTNTITQVPTSLPKTGANIYLPIGISIIFIICIVAYYRSKTKTQKTNESQKEFIRCYKHFLPVVDSDCVMNQICKYIENIDFHIREKVRSSQNFDYHTLMSDGFIINKKIYEQINDLVSSRIKEWAAKRTEKALDGAFTSKTVNPSKVLDRDLEYNILRQDLLTNICSNEEQLANHLIYLFYVDKQSYNKNILWALVGRQIYENIRKKTSVYYFPQKNPNGSLEFLYEKYSIERVLVSHEEEIEEEEKGIKEESFYD